MAVDLRHPPSSLQRPRSLQPIVCFGFWPDQPQSPCSPVETPGKRQHSLLSDLLQQAQDGSPGQSGGAAAAAAGDMHGQIRAALDAATADDDDDDDADLVDDDYEDDDLDDDDRSLLEDLSAAWSPSSSVFSSRASTISSSRPITIPAAT